MDKEVVVYIHNGILLGYKNEHIWDVMRWMNLEPITHSEVNQKKEKQILYINTHIYGI